MNKSGTFGWQRGNTYEGSADWPANDGRTGRTQRCDFFGFANGRDSAFAALYRRHQGPVFRFALHMSGQTEIAEEVTQEVFLTLIVDPKRYSPERGPPRRS